MSDEDVYDQVRGPLMRFAASLVGPGMADDLVSEVVVATLRRRSLTSLDNPQAYLMRAVLNRARSHGRHVQMTRAKLALLPADRHVDAATLEVRSDVVDTVAALPPQQRAAIFLVYWEDLTPTEAAKVMGVRPATLRRYLHLARSKLRRHLNDR